MAAQSDSDGEKLRAELAQLRAEILQLGETLKSIATDRSTAAYERMRQSAEGMQQQAQDVLAAAAREIEQRPLTATVYAFGIGFLLGMIFGRKS